MSKLPTSYNNSFSVIQEDYILWENFNKPYKRYVIHTTTKSHLVYIRYKRYSKQSLLMQTHSKNVKNVIWSTLYWECNTDITEQEVREFVEQKLQHHKLSMLIRGHK